MADVIKRLYEGMFLVDAAVATAGWDEVVASVQQVLNRADAEVQTLKKWDERRLSFEIEKCRRGTYILTYFMAPPEKIGALERDVQLSESLLRVLVLRADRIPQEIREAPTPAETGHRPSEHDEEGDDDRPRGGWRDRGDRDRDRDRDRGGYRDRGDRDRDRDRDRGERRRESPVSTREPRPRVEAEDEGSSEGGEESSE